VQALAPGGQNKKKAGIKKINFLSEFFKISEGIG
jgi:hypothetical protein